MKPVKSGGSDLLYIVFPPPSRYPSLASNLNDYLTTRVLITSVDTVGCYLNCKVVLRLSVGLSFPVI